MTTPEGTFRKMEGTMVRKEKAEGTGGA